jgi:hypothetical protein
LVVQIDNEVQKKQTATYSNGVSSSYTLTLSVPVKIFRTIYLKTDSVIKALYFCGIFDVG